MSIADTPGPSRDAGGPVFHIALAADWRRARAAGAYRVSTIGRTLAQQGYIHLSFAHQVNQVADRFYRDAGDLVLLEIDSARLTAPLVVEPGEGTSEEFPHLYGELLVEHVAAVRPYAVDSTGAFPPVRASARRSGRDR